LADGELQASDLEAFTTAVAVLTNLYGRHIKIEDDVVFPAAAQILSEAQKAEVGYEMAVRRGLRPGLNAAST
jgi:hemerythrin-like domain-containing protein